MRSGHKLSKETNKQISMFVNAQKIFGRMQKKLLPVVASGKGGWAIMGQDREVLLFTLHPFVPFEFYTLCIYYLFKIIHSIQL